MIDERKVLWIAIETYGTICDKLDELENCGLTFDDRDKKGFWDALSDLEELVCRFCPEFTEDGWDKPLNGNEGYKSLSEMVGELLDDYVEERYNIEEVVEAILSPIDEWEDILA